MARKTRTKRRRNSQALKGLLLLLVPLALMGLVLFLALRTAPKPVQAKPAWQSDDPQRRAWALQHMEAAKAREQELARLKAEEQAAHWKRRQAAATRQEGRTP